MIIYLSAGFLVLGFFFVISVTSSGGYGSPASSIFGLGLLIFAMGLILSVIAAGKNGKQETLTT